MLSLDERQRGFAQALLDTDRAVPAGIVGPDGVLSRKRFSVYRNNVFVGLTDALRANFPCVEKLVGDEFFAAMARAFVTIQPPDSPVLLRYGAEFPDFIAEFPPAAPLPYLADVARIEHAATEAYHEFDEPPLAPAALAAIPAAQSPTLRLRLHSSVRLVRSSFPAFTIWRMNVPGGSPRPVDLSDSEDILILRPQAEVDVRQVGAASYDFVAALRQGLTLEQAAAMAFAADPEFDLSENMLALIRMGAFAAFELNVEENGHE